MQQKKKMPVMSLISREYMDEERISELEDITVELSKDKYQRKQRLKKT